MKGGARLRALVIIPLSLAIAGITLALVAPDRPAQLYHCVRVTTPWYACVATAVPMAFSTDLFGFRYSGHTTHNIDKFILSRGAYEHYLLAFLKGAIQASPHPHPIAVDVGANVGQHALFMSKYAATVHAFEPYAPVLEKFRHTIAVNKVGNVVVHAVGLGDVARSLPFFEPGAVKQGTGSFVPGFVPTNAATAETSLQLVAGDDVLADVSPVAVIKMDIEGFEKPALKGLKRTLARDRPVVLLELTTNPDNPIAFQSYDELASVFPDEYDLFIFTLKDFDTGAYRIDLIDPQRAGFFRSKTQYDIVAAPRGLDFPREATGTAR